LLIEANMKKLFLLILLFSVSCFAQVQFNSVTFADTTTSAVITVPSWAYVAGLAKPDSMGDTLSFKVFLTASDTMDYALMVMAKTDSVYNVCLPDSTNPYAVSFPLEAFDPWRYFKVVFNRATTGVLTVIFKQR